MRVLLDTNVLARAAGGPPSPAHDLLLRLTHHEHVLIWSTPLSDELSRILRYDRVRAHHKLSDAEVDDFVNGIELIAERVPLTGVAPPVVPADPDDDYVVQRAILGRANVICTRDRDLLQPPIIMYCERFRIRIMNDIELLALLRSMIIQ